MPGVYQNKADYFLPPGCPSSFSTGKIRGDADYRAKRSEPPARGVRRKEQDPRGEREGRGVASPAAAAGVPPALAPASAADGEKPASRSPSRSSWSSCSSRVSCA